MQIEKNKREVDNAQSQGEGVREKWGNQTVIEKSGLYEERICCSQKYKKITH